jgi:hypothetical protein
VKNLASPSFFRAFDLLLGTGNPGSKLIQWSYDGVDWMRHRYSITGSNHGFVIEIISLTHPGRKGWSLMVTKEHWWIGQRSEPIRSVHWARPVSGNRKDIMGWFRKHERL